MSLRGGCLSQDDVSRVYSILSGQLPVPDWQRGKLFRAVRARMSFAKTVAGNSLIGAALDRRIQEVAWFRANPDKPGELLPAQIGTTPDAQTAHCFNSKVIHLPENFYVNKENTASRYRCLANFTGSQAKYLCPEKAEKNATFRNIPDKVPINISAQLNPRRVRKLQMKSRVKFADDPSEVLFSRGSASELQSERSNSPLSDLDDELPMFRDK